MALVPLGLRDLASITKYSVSTISAIIHNKHFVHAGKTFALKFLMQRDSCKQRPLASAALQARIKNFVAEETDNAPLTDQHLMRILHEQGYPLARRTVAKHRAAARIMPSFFRKQPQSELWKSQ